MTLAPCPDCGTPGLPTGLVCALCADDRMRRYLADEANAEMEAQEQADERDDQYAHDTDPSGCYDG